MMMIMLNCYHRLKYDWRDLKGFKGIVPIFLLYSAKNSYSAILQCIIKWKENWNNSNYYFKFNIWLWLLLLLFK